MANPSIPEPALSWRPVPETASGQYLLLERKADPYSSHTAMVRTPEAVLIIDPGSAPDQALRTSQLVCDVIGQGNLPVLIFLTHSHWDHLAALPLLSFPAASPVLVLAQANAVAVLARGDRQAAAAFLFNAECPRIEVNVPLLSPSAQVLAMPRHYDLAPGLVLELVPDQVILPSERAVRCDTIRLNGRDVARVFHTPGHSPDSICVQVGGLLWVGDLFVAANPAVAGVPGWNCQALLESLETVDRLLDALPLSLCCPGHGRCLPAVQARQVIAEVKAQAATLRDVATLDPQRVNLLIEFAEDLLSEGVALFTIIAGRLYTVSFHLEALEESQTAKEVLQTLDIDGLDAVLEELRNFAEEFRRQHRFELALPFKGAQAVGRIEKLFDTKTLHGLIDLALLRRARHLLNDFRCQMRGIEPPATRQSEALPPIVARVAETFSGKAEVAQELWDASDDSEAFRQALTRRLAAEASAVRLAIDLEMAPELPPVLIDRARLEDTLYAILSEFTGAGATRIRMTIGAAATGCCLEFRPMPDRILPCFTPRKIRFLDRGIRLGGGSLADVSTATATILALSLAGESGAI